MEHIAAIKRNIESVLVGKSEVIDLVLTAVVAGGHVLLEDMPGTGKTVLAKSLAKSIDASFSRIQFTPDLLPSDVTGLNVYNQKSGEFQLKKGAIFSNILLADEINRATPRTQSSLLECMEEMQVTIDGVSYALESPFLVLATQNPVETAGTYILPEAQLDRFLMKLSMGTPNVEEEIAIMNRFMKDNPAAKLQAVCSKEDLKQAKQAVKDIFIHPELVEYIAKIVEATRNHSDILIGVSPRGTLAMLNAVRSYAYVMGRKYVLPDDIQKLCVPVMAHRVKTVTMTKRGNGANEMIQEIVEQIPVPTEEWNKE